MTTAVGEKEIRVIISKGQMVAEMMIPPGFAREALTETMCVSLLQQSGVEITDKVMEAIRSMIANPPPPGQEQVAPLAQATPPTHGQDGCVQWLVSESVPDVDSEAQPEADGQDRADEAISHYERSVYVLVKSGDVIARVTEPTAGVDGRDVLGRNIAAKPGKSVALQVDESILRDSSGQLIAQVEGVLSREPGRVTIRQMIEVPEYVDFSTGNIDFCGDVVVRQGVRDCFVVQATGSVDVHGLIEAATIKCGGHLTARGGMAGRERGFITVGGHLVGKYLDNIQGQIDGDLEIEREVINCDLTIHGHIRSPRGTLIGGRMVVTGSVEVVAIGSGAGVTTELVLGSVPRLDPFVVQFERLIEQLTNKRHAIESEQKLMSKSTRMMSSSDKERQTELTFEYQNVVEKIREGVAVYEALKQQIRQQRTINLRVHRTLHQGVLITVDNQSFKIRNDTRGPIQIGVDGSKNVIYRAGGATEALSKIAYVKAAAIRAEASSPGGGQDK